MSMSDEVRANPRYKTPKKKEKKGFVKTFIPLKGDSTGEVVSKLIALIAIAALIVCAIILGLYFYHIFEAKQNQKDLSERYKVYNNLTQVGSADGSGQPSVTEIDGSGEIVRNPLVALPFAEEMIAINSDYVGYVSIPGVVNEAVVQYTDNDYYQISSISLRI